MPTTQGIYAVQYTEVEGFRDQYAPGGFEVTRVCDVDWGRRLFFVRDMLGWVTWTSGAPLLQRYLPDTLPAHTDSRNRPALYAVEARLVDCLGVPDIELPARGELIRYLDKCPTDPIPRPNFETFGLARYEIVYRPRTYRVLRDSAVASERERFVTRTSTYAATNFTIPGGHFKLRNPPNDVIPANQVKTEQTTEHTYVWHQVPADVNGQLPLALEANIKSCIGKTNHAPFDNRFPAETLLCLPVHKELTHNAVGDLVFDLHFKFLERRSLPNTGWNTTWYKVGGVPGFYSIIGVDNATLLYPLVDFNYLFSMIP